MLRMLLPLALVLAGTPSRAETRLEVVGEEDRDFDVTVTSAGVAQHCTLPESGGCALSLSPGPLHLTIVSGKEQRELDKTLPDERRQLLPSYDSPGLAYTGIGLLSGGAVLAALGLAVVVSLLQSTAPSDGPGPEVGFAFYTGVAAIGVSCLLAGGVLTAIGFARAGPTADLVAPREVPST